MADPSYSPIAEARQIFNRLLQDQGYPFALPTEIRKKRFTVSFSSSSHDVYFPVPLKETETASALKAIEASAVSTLADLKYGPEDRTITINLDKTTRFLFQAYLATVDGLGKLDKGVQSKLKDTDLLQAQSNLYRRMSANLYKTKTPGVYYHIHGSLEASTTLNMIGLESHRPDLHSHKEIVEVIEQQVQKFDVEELETLNAKHRQAGVAAFKYDDFVRTPHGRANMAPRPWYIDRLEDQSPPTPLPKEKAREGPRRVLEGIKVLELCRIIAGPTVTRILAEYGADVLKITSPNLSDVPFFQVDGNMGKHAADLDLKTENGRQCFESLLADVDIVVDSYRPGAIEKLGYGPQDLARMAQQRGKGIVYVNENCFGYYGPWAKRAGWQQIADCVTGVAWAQGQFMGLDEPVVPPFPISDYGTGCMGAIAALIGLYNRCTVGGSWHGKVSLMDYDLLLFNAGQYTADIQVRLREQQTAEFMALRHAHSVDQISSTTLEGMRKRFPKLFEEGCQRWYSKAYGAEINVVKPVAEIDGITSGFLRASRPNGFDEPSWEFGEEGDYEISG